MRKAIFILVIGFLLPLRSFAAASGVIDYPYIGLQFTIPDGWQGQEQNNSYLIQAAGKTGFISLMENNARQLTQLKQEFKRGLLATNIQLQHSGPIETLQNKKKVTGIGAVFSGHIDGVATKAYVINLINPYGHGMTIVAAAPARHYTENYKKLARQIAHSIVFSRPERSDQTTRWEQKLYNHQLTHTKKRSDTNNDQLTKISYTFCQNHALHYAFNHHTSTDASNRFSFSQSTEMGEGQWRVISSSNGKAHLQLRLDNGHTVSYIISAHDATVYLNKEAYKLANASDCR